MWSPLLTQRQPLKLYDIWGKSLQITGLSYFYHGYSCNYSCSVRYRLSLTVMFATHSNFWLLILMSPRQYLDFARNDPNNSERQSPIHWKVFGQKMDTERWSNFPVATVCVTVYMRCRAGNSMMMPISENRLNLYTIHIFWIARRENRRQKWCAF